MWVLLTTNVQSHVNLNEMVNDHIFVHVYNTYIRISLHLCIIRVQGDVRFWIKQKTNQDKNKVTEEAAYFNDKKTVFYGIFRMQLNLQLSQM